MHAYTSLREEAAERRLVARPSVPSSAMCPSCDWACRVLPWLVASYKYSCQRCLVRPAVARLSPWFYRLGCGCFMGKSVQGLPALANSDTFFEWPRATGTGLLAIFKTIVDELWADWRSKARSQRPTQPEDIPTIQRLGHVFEIAAKDTLPVFSVWL